MEDDISQSKPWTTTAVALKCKQGQYSAGDSICTVEKVQINLAIFSADNTAGDNKSRKSDAQWILQLSSRDPTFIPCSDWLIM